MESLSSSSSVRRRAWINSSRHWSTLEDPDGPSHCSSANDDDVFSDGKIENWLLGCGSGSCSETAAASNSRQTSFDSARHAYNFVDDLSLGADASVLNGGKVPSDAGSALRSSFQQWRRFSSSTVHDELRGPSLNLGDSLMSSCFSSSTWKSSSSVSEVLDLYLEKAEETLLDLGFGCEEPQVTVRIPPRFFTFPSQARGVNFRLFLDSQLRRISEEDPTLSLASRFRQVQVLTAMANAFYSLYSHVSRTPLQKLAPPEFSWSSGPAERMERFRSSVRSEPRSPVERLKDTVNKMCLYTGSPRGSDSTSPQPSPRKRSSLPDVVEVILKNKAGVTKKLDLGEQNHCGRDGTKRDLGERDQELRKVENDATAQRTDLKDVEGRTSLSSMISETEKEEQHPLLTSQAELDVRLTSCETTKQPVAMVTHDLICPQITESVHQAPFCCQNTQSLPWRSTQRQDGTLSRNPTTCRADDESTEEPAGADASRTCAAHSSRTRFSITVTGWEDADSRSASRVPARRHGGDESFHEKENRYLNPRQNLQPVNSFELEEVHSAGEEDSGGAPSTLSSHTQLKGAMARGDSVQSDSSGYADEEVGLTSDGLNR